MASRKWTPADDAMVRQMAEAGAFAHEIAAAIGRTKPAVQSRLRVIGVTTGGPLQLARLSADRARIGRATIHKARAVLIADAGEINARRRAGIYRARCKRLYPDLPEHLWPAVNAMRTKHGLLSREAYELVMADWKRDVLNALRAICAAAAVTARAEIMRRNSFEAQLERVRNGQARVVPTFRPGRVIAEQRSLIGGTMAELAA